MLPPEEKNRHVQLYEDRDSPVARSGLGARAGIFLLAGRYHVAAHSSPFERRLREEGALHVANLVFEPEPRDRAALSGGLQAESPPDPALRPLHRREAAAVFRPGFTPN